LKNFKKFPLVWETFIKFFGQENPLDFIFQGWALWGLGHPHFKGGVGEIPPLGFIKLKHGILGVTGERGFNISRFLGFKGGL